MRACTRSIILSSLFAATAVVLSSCEAVRRDDADATTTDAQARETVANQDGRAAALDELRSQAKGGSSEASWKLAEAYRKGQSGLEPNYQEAFHWYRMSAEAGNPKGANGVAVMFHNGLGVSQDHVAAAKWYRMGAEKGYSKAQNGIGVLLLQGQGVQQDLAAAKIWFEKSAAQGYAKAQDNLGRMHRDGTGMPKNLAEAARLFRLAAEQGYAKAQDDLGQLLLSGGQGVEKDPVEAYAWFVVAGNAAQADDLAKTITPQQLDRAQKKAAAFRASYGAKRQ